MVTPPRKDWYGMVNPLVLRDEEEGTNFFQRVEISL